jgi:hypothetical protein
MKLKVLTPTHEFEPTEYSIWGVYQLSIGTEGTRFDMNFNSENSIAKTQMLVPHDNHQQQLLYKDYPDYGFPFASKNPINPERSIMPFSKASKQKEPDLT